MACAHATADHSSLQGRAKSSCWWLSNRLKLALPHLWVTHTTPRNLDEDVRPLWPLWLVPRLCWQREARGALGDGDHCLANAAKEREHGSSDLQPILRLGSGQRIDRGVTEVESGRKRTSHLHLRARWLVRAAAAQHR